MDDALPWVAVLLLVTIVSIVLVFMILTARLGGWLRERWTKRRLRREGRHDRRR